MNNILLGSLVCMSAGALWLAQSTSLKNKQAENLRLTRKLAEIQASLQKTAVAWTNMDTDLKLRRSELKSADAELRVAMQEAQEIPLKPIDPEHEGSWPQEQPYFYLAKRHLDQIGYSPFSREGGVSVAAGLLFGMSPKEKQQVEGAYNEMRMKANQLQLAKAERIEPEAGVNTDNHREVSYKIAAMTNEVQELQNQFNSDVRKAIGNARSDIFLERAASVFEEDYSGNYGKANYILTSEATRKEDGTVDYEFKLTEPGSGTMYFPFEYPLQPGGPAWDNRHLFGEEPLIPPPQAPEETK
ncbi:hypothetical protein [Pedosphaera parvula]|uniref:Uncharacterized protein n=1 Tax=Pedosphaera parvula (strain Ellin514) TaxID=320771 RepID=B9XF59_PEDPL|nr:hypothetical protein [Pedosphaera parvula]EEF61557.1 hypothetical protein Cflav_PD4235 [Pedosphaera parvula Ellin514]